MKAGSVKVTDALMRKLEHTARQRGQSKSALIRSALEQYLNGDGAGSRPLSVLDVLGDLVGCAKGPGDLATNPKYMEGFGE